MTTRLSVTRPLDELLCSDCRVGIPLARVDGTNDRLCYGCISAAVTRAEAQAAIAEAELVMAQTDPLIARRLRDICEGGR